MSNVILTKKAKPSQRQYEVLIMRAMKMTYREIQERLSISQSTLRNHLTELMARFGCLSQGELIDLAKSQHWIQENIQGGGVAYRIKSYDEVSRVRIYRPALWLNH